MNHSYLTVQVQEKSPAVARFGSVNVSVIEIVCFGGSRISLTSDRLFSVGIEF